MSVVLIMDQYKRFEQAEQQRQKIDPTYEANKLSELANAFGNSLRRVAIINDHDRPGFEAYKQARYEIVNTNGTRSDDIQEFIARMRDDLERRPPEHLLVVTDDPTFRFLLDPIARQGDTHMKVWVLGKQVRAPFDDRKYHARLYNEIIPEQKVPKITVLLDYENLHIGLKQRGWHPNAKALIEATREAISDLGDIVKMTAYADWKLLEQNDQRDWQRELARMGVDTQYLLNERGKNTADMKIADAVRDLVERSANAPDAVDIVVLGTNDRDFRATVEKARERGQRIVLMAIKGGLSHHLINLLDPKEIRYIDEHLKLTPAISSTSAGGEHRRREQVDRARLSQSANPNSEWTELLMRFTFLLHQKRWQWAPRKELGSVATPERLQAAIDASVLKPSRPGDPKGLALNTDESLVQAVQFFVPWISGRVGHLVETRVRTGQMQYIDGYFLHKGMLADNRCKELGIGQKPGNAEVWLEAAAKAEVLVKQRLPRFNKPGKVDTWWPLSYREDKEGSTETPIAKPPEKDTGDGTPPHGPTSGPQGGGHPSVNKENEMPKGTYA